MKTHKAVHTLSDVTRFRCAGIALSLLTFFLVGGLKAQDFILDDYSLEGGGPSSGGEFELSGFSCGPDAGELVGGDFELSEGFWASAPETEISLPPGLNISLQQTDLLISWPQAGTGGFVLETTGDLAAGRGGPLWTRVDVPPQAANGVLTVRLPLGQANQFYRLHKF